MKRGIVLAFGILFVLGFLGVASAEKLGIDTGNSYVPGDEIRFKIILYDDNTNPIQGQVNYVLMNFYKEPMIEGVADSGQEIVYKLPTDAYQGPWEIDASYKDIKTNIKFNVGQLEKAEIRLEGDILVLKNIGNSVYDKKVLIYIGNNDQTAEVYLDVGQEKRIRLTAPDGSYNIKVIEGNEENAIEFDNVHLTGNVIGLESVLGGGNFWQKYPIVALFLGALLLVVIVISILKFKNRGINIKIANKNINKNKRR